MASAAADLPFDLIQLHGVVAICVLIGTVLAIVCGDGLVITIVVTGALCGRGRDSLRWARCQCRRFSGLEIEGPVTPCIFSHGAGMAEVEGAYTTMEETALVVGHHGGPGVGYDSTAVIAVND